MTTEEFLTIINNYFIPRKQEKFSRFVTEKRQQEMWATGQLICLFDSLLDEGKLFHWEPQFPLHKALPEPTSGKRTQQKVDFMVRIDEASEPIYIEVKAVI